MGHVLAIAILCGQAWAVRWLILTMLRQSEINRQARAAAPKGPHRRSGPRKPAKVEPEAVPMAQRVTAPAKRTLISPEEVQANLDAIKAKEFLAVHRSEVGQALASLGYSRQETAPYLASLLTVDDVASTIKAYLQCRQPKRVQASPSAHNEVKQAERVELKPPVDNSEVERIQRPLPVQNPKPITVKAPDQTKLKAHYNGKGFKDFGPDSKITTMSKGMAVQALVDNPINGYFLENAPLNVTLTGNVKDYILEQIREHHIKGRKLPEYWTDRIIQALDLCVMEQIRVYNGKYAPAGIIKKAIEERFPVYFPDTWDFDCTLASKPTGLSSGEVDALNHEMDALARKNKELESRLQAIQTTDDTSDCPF